MAKEVDLVEYKWTVRFTQESLLKEKKMGIIIKIRYFEVFKKLSKKNLKDLDPAEAEELKKPFFTGFY